MQVIIVIVCGASLRSFLKLGELVFCCCPDKKNIWDLFIKIKIKKVRFQDRINVYSFYIRP